MYRLLHENRKEETRSDRQQDGRGSLGDVTKVRFNAAGRVKCTGDRDEGTVVGGGELKFHSGRSGLAFFDLALR
jgi:hypothetical protein